MRDVDSDSSDARAEEDNPGEGNGTPSNANARSATPGHRSYIVPFQMMKSEETACVEYARSQLPMLLRECDPVGSAGAWKRRKSKRSNEIGGVHVWERMQRPVPDKGVESSSLNGYAVRSSVTIRAPLEMVLKTLDCSVMTSYRSFMKIIYGDLIVDTSVLFQSQLRKGSHAADSADEALAVRWVMCRCNAPMVSDCDFSLMEYTKVLSPDEVAPPNNNEEESMGHVGISTERLRTASRMPVAYKLISSIETKYCPILGDSRRVLRCKVPLAGFLFYRTDCCDVTDVVFYMAMERPECSAAMGDRQVRAVQQNLLRMAKAIGRLRNAVDAYYMSLRLENLRTTRWVDNSERRECAVCYRRFHQLTRRRHHCRLCGEVICRDCSVHKDADLPTLGPTLLRICLTCDAEVAGVYASCTPGSSRALTPSSGQGRTPTTPEPPSRSRNARRTTIAADNTKQTISRVERKTEEAQRRRFATIADAVEACSADIPRQSMSCPKAAILDHSSRSSKWAVQEKFSPMAREARQYGHTEANTISRSKKRESTPQRTIRFHWEDDESSGFPMETDTDPGADGDSEQSNQDSEREIATSVGKPQRQGFVHGQGFARTLPHVSVFAQKHHDDEAHRSLRQPTKRAQSNQNDEAAQDGERVSGEWLEKPLEQVHTYEDILNDLCGRVCDALEWSYAAVSVFEPSTGHEEALKVRCYMRPRKSDKLLPVAPSMRLTDPVLHLRRAVCIRDILGQESAALLPEYDIRALPVVQGPQKVRAYVGIPLRTSKMHVLGALAVLHSEPCPRTDPAVLTQSLESAASAALASLESRKTQVELDRFMSSPLLETTRRPEGHRPRRSRHRAATMAGPLARESFDVLRRSSASDERVTFSDEEDVRDLCIAAHNTPPRTPLGPKSPGFGHGSTRATSIETYKEQMRRLVLQARQTQVQMEQNAMTMQLHGVSL